MALLNRLFSSKRKQQPKKGYGLPVPAQANCKTFEFSKDQVRVLLFRECEHRGRKLLFDSKAVKKVPLPSSLQCSRKRKGVKAEEVKKGESFVEITNGYGYQYTRPSADIKPIGEMIFGSVAMALRGSTFKVHIGATPPVLMVTKVSNSPSKRESDRSLEDSYGSSISSMNEYLSAGGCSSDSKLSAPSGSCPLDVPVPSSLKLGGFITRNDRTSHLGSMEADSGCYTNSDCSISGPQPFSSFNATLASPDSRKGSGGSLSSLRRRWLRTASTSLDLDSNQSLTQTDSLASCGSLSACNDEKPYRRTKLGVAIIISLTEHQKTSMQEFFLVHSALLESIAARLHAAVERAYSRKELFVSMMFDASVDVEQSMEDLLLGPRLALPVWLGLLSSQGQHSTIAAGFMQELCQMIDILETKDTNFFMSTLVTAVLTHHLGWVPTVTPGLSFRQSSLDGTPPHCNLSDLPKMHPYNPLWAQAMDLYGALGNPLKTARTIIMSVTSNKSRVETIERLLRIISYFVRCAAIERQEAKLEDFDFKTSMSHCALISKQENVQTLTIDDRTSSSSTLRPISGKCSPLPNVCQISTPVNASEMSDGYSLKPKGFSGPDNMSSKSETCLDSKQVSAPSLKQQSNVGLRRTLSYSSRMTSSALVENLKNKDKVNPLSITSSNRKDLITSAKGLPVPATSFGGTCPDQNGPQDLCSPLEKVIFVLGENENLVGLKGQKKTIADLDAKKCPIEAKMKHQEQPLSFSGSEVESGFSECESFELSPVRTTCGDLGTSDDKIVNQASRAFSPIIEPRLWCSKNKKNVENLHNSVNHILCKDDTIPFCDLNSYMKSEIVNNNSVNLRSLARSLSVNLPVCLEPLKYESCVSDICVACGNQIEDAESKENLHPVKESRQTFNKKSMKRLRRAYSSFCVQSQSRKSLKSILMCQNCDLDQVGSCTVESSSLNNFRKQPNSRLSLGSKVTMPSNVVELPLPASLVQSDFTETVFEWGIAGSLFGGVSSHYIPERVLQGCAPMMPGWEVTLKRDLTLNAQHPILDSGLSEAVAIVANIDLYEVQLVSSHTYVVDRPGNVGIRAGLSQLVANMLESVYHMWKLHVSPEMCLSFLESRLQEILIRSQALSELLLTSEFCDMDNLTSSLSLEPNDVPLLLSVASTHSPEVTQRYGLTFR